MPEHEGQGVLITSIPKPLPENPYQRLLYGSLISHGAFLLDENLPLPKVLLPEILHVHWLFLKGPTWRQAWRARRLARGLTRAAEQGVRVVWTAHNLEPHDLTAPQQKLTDHLAHTAHGVIAHSHATAQAFRAAYPHARAQVAVIPHGNYRGAYPAPTPRSDARTHLGLPVQQGVFLAFGQIRSYKGYETLVEAYRQSTLDAHLVVAGHPKDPAVARRLRALAGNDPRIHLRLEFQDDPSTAALFSAADAVVFPYRRITTSGGIPLALTFDRPVIIPDLPSLREELEPEAFVVFHGDDDLVPALARALEGPREIREAAARASADRLDWGPIGAATYRFFERLLE